MFDRVTADLFFTEEDEANDFYHDCQLAILKSQTINPNQPDQERGEITLHHCTHDEPHINTCTLLKSEQSPLPPP